jgi:hypothetical protein
LVCSEPLGERLAGIGLRYVELARRLSGAGFAVAMLAPFRDQTSPEHLREVLGLGGASLALPRPGGLREQLDDIDVVVGQGQLMNNVVLEVPELPTVVDLYDPWLVENLHYVAELGLDPFRNDHASWVLQLARGDFFLCSSEEQRLFYLGFLSALGRVHPYLVARDPDLRGLIETVPFGLPAAAPEHRPWLPERAPGERRILFGGLYAWYDPFTLLEAFVRLDRAAWKLLFIRQPHDDAPQGLLGEVERWARRRGLWGSRVVALDWVPFERRYDLLRDVDALAAPHAASLESRLSMRTRFLDALLVGCPTLSSELGAIGRLVRERQAGWVVPVGDVTALASALVAAIEGDERERAERLEAGRHLATELTWQRVLEPLVAFCRTPRRDESKDDFGFKPATLSPADPISFRIGRRLRRWLGSAP